MVVVVVVMVSRIRARATGRLGLPLSAIGFAVSAGMTRIDKRLGLHSFCCCERCGGVSSPIYRFKRVENQLPAEVGKPRQS